MKAAAKADAAEAKKLPTAEKSPLMKSQTPTITSRTQRNGVARKSKTAPPMALSPSSTERSPVRTCQTVWTTRAAMRSASTKSLTGRKNL